VFVLVILAIDLGVLNRRAHVVSIREALTFTIGLFVIALAFNGLVYVLYENQLLGLGTHVDAIDNVRNDGRLAAVKFFTGYVIEVSLSADNVFVMAMVFQHLRVPPQFQHRVLFWGILGALVMRGAMILIGTTLIARYHWILYLFGAFLVFTAVRMLLAKDALDADVTNSPVIRLVRRFFPVTGRYDAQHFVTIENGRRVLTPLAIALVLVETTDLVFAVDSIPAIFAITTDPFIVFTSNVFAILGLRSLYFALAGAMEKFHYLKASLAAILALVGVKMLVADLLKAYIGPSFNYYLLAMVTLILAGGVVASLKYPKPPHQHSDGQTG
jgi:tellurite resistance protein TerC